MSKERELSAEAVRPSLRRRTGGGDLGFESDQGGFDEFLQQTGNEVKLGFSGDVPVDDAVGSLVDLACKKEKEAQGRSGRVEERRARERVNEPQ